MSVVYFNAASFDKKIRGNSIITAVALVNVGQDQDMRNSEKLGYPITGLVIYTSVPTRYHG